MANASTAASRSRRSAFNCKMIEEFAEGKHQPRHKERDLTNASR